MHNVYEGDVLFFISIKNLFIKLLLLEIIHVYSCQQCLLGVYGHWQMRQLVC